MPASPSLLIVPARFKTGKLYTQIATTSAGAVLGSSGDFNVTRGTTATRFNSAGLIESVASGVPRLDYFTSGGTAGCPALLVEPQAQNIMAQSETLSVSGNWARNAVLVSGGAIASPDGLASGTLIVASGSAEHNINRNAATTVASGAVVTTSCFFKAHGTNNFAQLLVGGFTFSPTPPYANFSLSGNGAVTTGVYSSAFIENYGNGWYRCGFSVTAAASGTPSYLICPIIASGTARNASFVGDGVNGVYAWGAQVETGSVATSYIPTTTAAVTRNADVISLSGAVSGCIGQTEGTIYAEVDVRNLTAGARVPIYLLNALGSPTDSVRFEFSNSNGWQATVRANNANAFTVSGPTSQPQGIYKVAFGYKSGNSALYINGGEAATNSSSFIFNAVLAIVAMHGITAGANVFNDRIRAAALYTTRLTDSELAALTT